MIRSLSILGALALLASASAHATTYYAGPGGGAAASCVDTAANICTVARCISVAANTDTCSLAPGTYPGSELGGSGYVIETGEFVSLICAGDVGSCIFQPTGTNVSGIRLNTPVAGGTFTVTGVKIDGSLATPLDQCFYFSDATALYAVESADNSCLEADIYDFRVVANEMTLTSTRDAFTTTTAVSPRSFVATVGTWADGGMSIDSANVTIAKYDDTAAPVVNILATDAGETGSVTNSTFTITNNPATTTGYIDVIHFKGVPNAVATGNTIAVSGAFVGTTGAGCAAAACRQVRAIKSYATSAIDNSGANISNNTITVDAANGQMIAIGDDTSGSGNTYSAYGTAKNNTITCVTGRTSTHGVGFFYSRGGRASGNKIVNCGIALLSKGQPTEGAIFSGNIVEGAWEEAMYSKGSTAPTFVGNSVDVTNTAATPVVVGIDSVTNSTNVKLYNNSFFTSNGSTPTDLVNTASSQTIAGADANNWYGFTSPQWTYLGVAYASLSLWNAIGIVGTDLAVDPDMIGGDAPTTTSGYKLAAASPLRRAGAELNIGNFQDFGDRAFLHPPSIGAWEATSGDIAVARTARTAPIAR